MTNKLTRIGLGLLLGILVHTSTFGQCNPVPKASFSTRDGCEADSVPFTNNSQNATSFEWQFGDGNSSTIVSPKHLYSYYGDTRTFTVGLFAYSNNKKCGDSFYVSVTTYGTSAEFTLTNSGKTYNFKSTGKWISSYHWDFGDGDTANTANPSHTYTDTLSSHTVCLTVSNPMSCTNEKCIKIATLGLKPIMFQTPKFNIYPNPSHGNFTIEFEKIKVENILQIINPMGQLVFGDILHPGTQKLNVNLAEGIYWVKVVDSNGNANTRSILVQN